jgi:lactate dehydrogenase-like 2-hydroxyacid dehydrogenase
LLQRGLVIRQYHSVKPMQRKPILVVTLSLMPAVEQRLATAFEARRNPFGRPFTQDELLAAAEGADALLVTPSDKLDVPFFERLPESVKIISTFSVGFDHLDTAAAAKAGVPVANTPNVLTDATADVALLLLLGASRRAYESQQLVRTGAWAQPKSPTFLGWQITGKRLGIFGMGRIGQAVAARARSFGMEIHYFNRHQLPADEELGATFHATAEDLLRVSTFLSLHAPSTSETRHFLNSDRIALLPEGAIVVNTARGGLVDDDALITALRSGRIAAAGLDVFEGEPAIHPGYVDLPNTFLLPHIGSATLETRTAMGMLALDNIEAVLAGRPGPTVIPATLGLGK